jgi:SAM-dependent methyltransferase
MKTNPTAEVSQKNSIFWDELCGSYLAKSLGVVDNTPASLKKFDDWYFAYYPYLFVHIPFEEIRGKDVLEIGLGYGTVAQRLAEAGANYEGLDIAAGPVEMVRHRLSQAGLPGDARQGSILEAPFQDGSFDFVIAIGCLHHTGDLKRAIAECYRVLRPGGKLVFMVYYSYSYRRFFQSPKETISYFFRELFGYRGVVGLSVEKERAAYDANASGDGAPHTDWISKQSLSAYCEAFTSFNAMIENIDNGPPFERSPPRRELLKTWYPRWFGLDLYATVVK